MVGRRTFLRWATAVGGAVATLLAGVPALRAFLSPTFRHTRKEKWIPLGQVDQFDPNVPTKVDFVDTVHDAWIETRENESSRPSLRLLSNTPITWTPMEKSPPIRL